MKGAEVVSLLRKELEVLNREILEHPYIRDAEEGKLSINAIKRFVINQLYIVPHDLKSLAFMLARSRYRDEIDFFKMLVDGDYRALKALYDLAKELGIDIDNPGEPIPEAVAYTHYLSWLALHASLGEAAIAMIVNLPVWGSNTSRLAKALRERYGIKSLDFLEMFAGPYNVLEEAAYPIIERYLDIERYRRVSRMIQRYEKMFWDAIYS